MSSLRVVRAVATHKSLSEAARALGYSQPAISRQVAAAEAAVGEPLFVRHPRGVSLTRAGAVVARFATETLTGLEHLEERIDELASDRELRVRVGSFPAANAALLPLALARLMEGHPRITFTLAEASSPSLVHQVGAGRLDVAVIALGQGLPQAALEGLRLSSLESGELCVGVPAGHRLHGAARVPVAELEKEPWIVGRGTRDEPHFGVWPTLSASIVRCRARSWTARLGLVAAGLGICLLPEMMAHSVPAGVGIVRVEDPTWLGRSVLAVTPHHTTELHELVVGSLHEAASAISTETP
nr:LysR family transcriptional regulator [Nocardiopsis sinuspersici]